jgi:hypothetical protein
MSSPSYTTNDAHLSSFLLSEGCPLICAKRLGPKRVEFRFAADRTLHELVRLYWSGQVIQVSPLRLFGALRQLKSRPRNRPNASPKGEETPARG